MAWFFTSEDWLRRIEWKIDKLLAASRIIEGMEKMAQADIDALKGKVQKNTDAAKSAVDLINGLAAQIRDLADDPAELRALADQLDSDATKLGDAVTANTPAGKPTPA